MATPFGSIGPTSCRPQSSTTSWGNPPFVGKQHQSDEQKEDLETVFQGIKGAGVLDYAAAWYIKAARNITTAPDSFAGIAAAASGDRKQFKDLKFGGATAGFGDLFVDVDRAETLGRRKVRCGFVSTNSITQGEWLPRCGAGCWRQAGTCSSPTTPFSGPTTRRGARRCTA